MMIWNGENIVSRFCRMKKERIPGVDTGYVNLSAVTLLLQGLWFMSQISYSPDYRGLTSAKGLYSTEFILTILC